MKKPILLLFFGVICLGVVAQTPSAHWNLTGNEQIDTAHFIGTTDKQPLIFKTNNVERMRLLSDQSFLGIGTPTPQASLHIQYQYLNPKGFPLEDPSLSLVKMQGTGMNKGFRIVSYPPNGAIALKQEEIANLFIHGPSGGLTIAPNGDIGVGIGVPQAKLDVNGSLRAQSATITGNLTVGNIKAESAKITNTLEAKALNAQSASLTGALSAESATISGAVTIKGTVNGKNANFDGLIRTKEVNVTLSGWSDFVFDEDYELMPLSEVKQFITQNKHLPNVPSEAEVITHGVNIGEMNAILLQKVEELTLYIIDLQKQIDELKK